MEGKLLIFLWWLRQVQGNRRCCSDLNNCVTVHSDLLEIFLVYIVVLV
jgi:hypothetical protein